MGRLVFFFVFFPFIFPIRLARSHLLSRFPSRFDTYLSSSPRFPRSLWRISYYTSYIILQYTYNTRYVYIYMCEVYCTPRYTWLHLHYIYLYIRPYAHYYNRQSYDLISVRETLIIIIQYYNVTHVGQGPPLQRQQHQHQL